MDYAEKNLMGNGDKNILFSFERTFKMVKHINFTDSTYLVLFSKYFGQKNERKARSPPSWIFRNMHAYVTTGVTQLLFC